MYGVQFQIKIGESADNFKVLNPSLQEFQIAVLIFQILQSSTRCRSALVNRELAYEGDSNCIMYYSLLRLQIPDVCTCLASALLNASFQNQSRIFPCTISIWNPSRCPVLNSGADIVSVYEDELKPKREAGRKEK
jgi:hypothetical protein